MLAGGAHPSPDPTTLQRTGMQHDGSGWHWDPASGGEGLQHLALKTAAQRQTLREQLLRSGNGDPTLQIVDATLPGFAETAAEVFHRDGFVAVCKSPSPPLLVVSRYSLRDCV